MSVTTTLDADLLRDFPTDSDLSAILETTQPSLIGDRLSGGGVYTAQPARIGSFLSSWTQTEYRLGDIDITDPTTGGIPLLVVDPDLWGGVRITTGMMPSNVDSSGLTISLDPQAPLPQWASRVFGSGAWAATAPTSGPPTVARLDGWGRGSGVASGPLQRDVDGRPRLGAFFAGAWTHGSSIIRSETKPVVSSVGSAFANFVFSPSDANEVHAIAWVQGSSYPSDLRVPFNQLGATTADTAFHLQATWDHGAEAASGIHVFGGFTGRNRTPDGLAAAGAVFERLLDGPVSQVEFAAPGLATRWTLGVRPRHSLALGANTVDWGIEVDGARNRSDSFYAGRVGELVAGTPARIWAFNQPLASQSIRRSTTLAGYATDKLNLGAKLVVHAGLRFDGVTAAADGAPDTIGWQSLLPRAGVEWKFARKWTALAGYSQSAYRLPLDLLAIGDPGAPTASVFPWASASTTLPAALPAGPPVALIGPGMIAGGPSFSRIDAGLRRPTTDEITVGIEMRPNPSLRLRLQGYIRRERDLIGLVDTGTPASSFSVIQVPDPGLLLLNPADDQLLPVYNRLPSSFGQDRYLLTNPSEDAAVAKTMEFASELRSGPLVFFAGATASMAEGPAAAIGYGPLENDQDVLGDTYVDPNWATFARGRLFVDRAFTIKASSTLQLPAEFRLGVIASYQDGQPFSRIVVVPVVNQGTVGVRAFTAGGSRFTFTETVDLRLQKGFPIGRARVDGVLDVFNLLNTANELDEQTVTGPTYRDPTTIQPPRAFHAGVRVSF